MALRKLGGENWERWRTSTKMRRTGIQFEGQIGPLAEVALGGLVGDQQIDRASQVLLAKLVDQSPGHNQCSSRGP